MLLAVKSKNQNANQREVTRKKMGKCLHLVETPNPRR